MQMGPLTPSFMTSSPLFTANPTAWPVVEVQYISSQIYLFVFVHLYVLLKTRGVILCLCLKTGKPNILGFNLFFHSIVCLGDPAMLIHSYLVFFKLDTKCAILP